MIGKYSLLFLVFPLQAFAHSEESKGEDNTAFLFLRQPPPPARPTTTAAVNQAWIPAHVFTETSIGITGVVILLFILLVCILWRRR